MNEVNGFEQFGRYLEQFEPGMVFKHWPGKTITESDNNMFSLLTMNHHPVHLDHHYLAGQVHGRPLVVGTLVFSLVVGMTVADISGKAIANLEYERVKHIGPVFIGDSLYATSTVLSVTPSRRKTDRGVLEVKTTAHNQRNEQVLEFNRKVLLPSKSNPDAGVTDGT